MKILSLLVFILVLSCQENPQDKSILEPLSIDVLKEEMSKDTIFEYTYEAIEKLRNEKLTTGVLRAKYGDITYREANQFVHYMRDTTNRNNLRDKIRDEWRQEYSEVLQRVDSTANYWKDYCDKNNLDIANMENVYTIKAFAVPFRIQYYWKYYEDNFMFDFYREQIALSLLNEEIETQIDYLRRKLDSTAIKDFGKVGEVFTMK